MTENGKVLTWMLVAPLALVVAVCGSYIARHEAVDGATSAIAACHDDLKQKLRNPRVIEFRNEETSITSGDKRDGTFHVIGIADANDRNGGMNSVVWTCTAKVSDGRATSGTAAYTCDPTACELLGV